jgi:hypothetical protein
MYPDITVLMQGRKMLAQCGEGCGVGLKTIRFA